MFTLWLKKVPTIEKTASDLAIETNNRLYANKVLPEKQTGFIDNTEADLNQLYSCDELDTLWLKRYNRQKGTRIAIATLEKVLNEFEDAIFEYLYENHLMNLFESQPFENAPSYQVIFYFSLVFFLFTHLFHILRTNFT